MLRSERGRAAAGRGIAPVVAVVLATLALHRDAAADGRAGAGDIYVGLYLHDVTKFDQKDGVFDVDAEIWAKWRGDFDPERIVLANAAASERSFIGAKADGSWHSARWRVRGTLRGEFPLHRFPFDAQTIAVTLELDERAGNLVPDLASSGIAERFSITGWLYDPEFRPRVSSVTYRSDLGSLEGEGSPTAVRRVSFEVVLHRPPATIALKLFLPLAIILMVALIALFLSPDLVDPRSAIGVTALLSCFAFQFTVSDTMPAVTYLTLADSLFLVAYVASSLALLESIVAYRLHKRSWVRGAIWLDRFVRLLLPLGSAAAVFLMAPSLVEPEVVSRLGVPETERPLSGRPLLRVGTTTLPSLLGSPVAPGVYWGAVHEEPGGTRYPFAVTEAPGVDSDALRFLAGGDVGVRWTLRRGLRWSDGHPLVATDLSFGLQMVPDPHVKEMKVRGPHALLLRYDDRLAGALENITPYPAHVLRKIFAEGGYEAVLEHRRKNAVPSLGPYHVTEFVPDDHLVAEANPHFPGPPPSIARVEVKKLATSADLVKAFEAGEIDITSPNSVTPEEALDLMKRRPDAVRIRPSAIQVFLQPDLAHPLLAKRDVRRAILMSIDRDRLVREIWGDAGRVSHIPVPGPLPPGTLTVPFDAAGAKKALEAAGAAGTKLIVFHTKAPVDKAVAAFVKASLDAAGLVITLQEEEKALPLYKKRTHGGLLVYAALGERDASPEKYWNLPIVEGTFAAATRHDAYDDAIAALVEREKRALYPERRDQLRDVLFTAYAERLPVLPLAFAAERVIADPKLHGWDHADPDARFGMALERWYFEAPPPASAPASGPSTAPSTPPSKPGASTAAPGTAAATAAGAPAATAAGATSAPGSATAPATGAATADPASAEPEKKGKKPKKKKGAAAPVP